LEEQTGEATLTERVLEVSSRLGQALKQASAGSLGFAEWKDIWRDEVDVENQLIKDAKALATAGALAEAIRQWTTIADLNDQLVDIGEILAGQADSGDTQAITGNVELAADFRCMARGRALLLTSVSQRLSSSPAEAAKSAEAAREQFELLEKPGGSFSKLAPVLMLTAEAVRLAACGFTQLLMLQYANASLTFLEARKTMEKARTRFLQIDHLKDEGLLGFTADISLFGVASKLALFRGAISLGNFEEAGKHLVEMIKTSFEIDAAPLSTWIKQLNEVDRGSYRGYLAYVNAEIAANRQNWDQAEQQLDEAEEEWNRTVETAVALDIPQSRQLAELTRATSMQLIGPLRRRIIREQKLYADMAELEAKNDKLHGEILEMAKRPSIGSSQGGIKVSSGDFVGGHKVRDIVGGDKAGRDITKAGGDVVHGDKTVGMDFSQIWQQHANEIDLAELSKELEALLPRLESSGGDEHDAEIGAVAVAQKAAAQNDGPKTLKWLKAAGKWVLEAADIAPIVVKALEIVL
jgi:hypothetical protein